MFRVTFNELRRLILYLIKHEDKFRLDRSLRGREETSRAVLMPHMLLEMAELVHATTRLTALNQTEIKLWP